MQATVPRLRPMGLGDLLDATFALYRDNFALFVGIVAVFTVPVTLITILIRLGAGAFGALAVIPLSFVFAQMMTGAMAMAVSRRYLGQSTTIGDAYRAVGTNTYLRLIAAAIVFGIICTVTLPLLLLGVYLYVRWVFYPQAIVIERTSLWGAQKRSSELTRGNWWRVFGILIVVGVLVAILEGVVSGLAAALVNAGGAGGVVTGSILSAIVAILVQPIEMVALTLLYYDLRIRKEGFDIEYLARHLETSPAL